MKEEQLLSSAISQYLLGRIMQTTLYTLANDQLDARILVHLLQSSTCTRFEQYLAHPQEFKCINTASGIATIWYRHHLVSSPSDIITIWYRHHLVSSLSVSDRPVHRTVTY